MNKYETTVGLTVYNLNIPDKCHTCGTHLEWRPSEIQLPHLEELRGYFDKMLRQMAENYWRVDAINKKAAALRQLTDEVDLQIRDQKILQYRKYHG